MTLEMMTDVLAPAARGALRELSVALDCPLDAWVRESAGCWRVAESGTDSDIVPIEADASPLAALLEVVYASGRTSSAEADDQHVWIASPLVDAAGAVQAIAVATLEARPATYAARLADSVLNEIHQRQEIEWLRDENYVFSHQVTDDFEELTFLRTMATRLVVDDTTLDINRIVDRTIGDLREMIGAETIYFVTAPPQGGLSIGQVCPAKAGEEAPVEAETIIRLARVHRARAAQSPCIKNDLSACDPQACGAGVRQFLMAPIGVGGRQFGWFVAINRTTIGRRWAPSPLLQLGQDEFGTWEASLLNTAATLLASHASNLDLIREKERLLINTVRSLV